MNDCSDEARLWRSHRAGQAAARRCLYELHLSLVQTIARRLIRRYPMAALDDLIGAGTIGLGEALDRFRPERGLQFSTFAGHRIRGAMLDWIRGQSALPRSLNRLRRRLDAVEACLMQRQCAPVVTTHLAAALELTEKWYWHIRDAIGITEVPLVLDALAGSPAPAPIDELVREEERAQVRAAVRRLPERMREVVVQYHFEGRSLRDIGRELHVTDSRISQILRSARHLLRRELTPAPATA